MMSTESRFRPRAEVWDPAFLSLSLSLSLSALSIMCEPRWKHGKGYLSCVWLCEHVCETVDSAKCRSVGMKTAYRCEWCPEDVTCLCVRLWIRW